MLNPSSETRILPPRSRDCVISVWKVANSEVEIAVRVEGGSEGGDAK